MMWGRVVTEVERYMHLDRRLDRPYDQGTDGGCQVRYCETSHGLSKYSAGMVRHCVSNNVTYGKVSGKNQQGPGTCQ